jgi:ubiquinone/menaquinone biosynthesis C-methylase UbiE
MLTAVRRRAERAGVANRIRLRLAGTESLGLTEAADFAVAFWMLHEVPDQERFLAEVRANLQSAGRLLVVEPRAHVSKEAFERSMAIARSGGWRPIGRPNVALSRAALLGV